VVLHDGIAMPSCRNAVEDRCGPIAPSRVLIFFQKINSQGPGEATENHFTFASVVVSLVHTSLGSSYLIAHVLHSPPPPRAQLCKRSCSNKHTHLRMEDRRATFYLNHLVLLL